MNADEVEFLREIASDPDDDVARLIYADWLEERGDPRGMFIRVQCELQNGCWGKRRAVLQSNAKILLKNHGETWRAPFKKWGNVAFHKGLPEQVTLETKEFAKHGSEIVEDPRVRHIRIVKNTKSTIERFSRLPARSKIRSLGLNSGALPHKYFAHFFRECPTWPELESLDLSRCQLDAKAIRSLIETEMPNLKYLNLASNRLQTAGLESLCGWTPFTKVEHLNLNNNKLSARDVQSLLSSPFFQRELKLHFASSDVFQDNENEMDDECLAAWTASPAFPLCGRVRFDCNSITYDGCEILDSASERSNIVDLRLRWGLGSQSNVGLDPNSILGSLFVKPCRSLRLYATSSGHEAILDAIIKSETLDNLEHLALPTYMSMGKRQQIENMDRFANISVTFDDQC